MNDSQYLQHYGVGGMKWGQRRYQNPDGSLTAEGRARYGKNTRARARLYSRSLRDLTNRKRSFMEMEEMSTKSRAKLMTKRDRYSEEGKDRKVNRLNKKIAKETQRIEWQKALKKNSEELVDSIIKDAMVNNYRITSKDVTRGKNIVNKIFGVSPTTVTESKVKKTRYSK